MWKTLPRVGDREESDLGEWFPLSGGGEVWSSWEKIHHSYGVWCRTFIPSLTAWWGATGLRSGLPEVSLDGVVPWSGNQLQNVSRILGTFGIWDIGSGLLGSRLRGVIWIVGGTEAKCLGPGQCLGELSLLWMASRKGVKEIWDLGSTWDSREFTPMISWTRIQRVGTLDSGIHWWEVESGAWNVDSAVNLERYKTWNRGKWKVCREQSGVQWPSAKNTGSWHCSVSTLWLRSLDF